MNSAAISVTIFNPFQKPIGYSAHFFIQFFFFFLLRYFSCLYILEINPFSGRQISYHLYMDSNKIIQLNLFIKYKQTHQLRKKFMATKEEI